MDMNPSRNYWHGNLRGILLGRCLEALPLSWSYLCTQKEAETGLLASHFSKALNRGLCFTERKQDVIC